MGFIAILIRALLLCHTAAAACHIKNPFLENDDPMHGYKTNPKISHNLGNYSPFYSVPSKISSETPSTCTVTFAQSLTRHGARYPTDNKDTKYRETISKIPVSTSFEGKYAFLKDFNYSLGANDLTPFGQQQLVNAGTKFYQRYAHLSRTSDPFIRASGTDRVVMSAQNFSQGFHVSKLHDPFSTPGDFPLDILIIPEQDGINNTLDHGLCTSFENDDPYASLSDEKRNDWISVFAPSITARLNHNLPGASFTDTDTVYLMDQCPFQTIASSDASLSPFCFLFSEEEWLSYNYLQDLDQYYAYGPGNPLGPTQGVGFVNELIARLTNSSVVDHTSTNSTLDSDEETFPLGLSLYADFSHDSDMTAIFAAMGLDNGTVAKGGLDSEKREEKGFRSSWTVPFAGRMFLEKMVCEDEGDGEEELVRVLVNDAVQPLEFCGGDELGRCALENFVESLSWAANGGRWALCEIGEVDEAVQREL